MYDIDKLVKESREIAYSTRIPDEGWAMSEDGRVACNAFPAQSANGWIVRTGFYLDGKRISRDNLIKVISDINPV